MISTYHVFWYVITLLESIRGLRLDSSVGIGMFSMHNSNDQIIAFANVIFRFFPEVTSRKCNYLAIR